MINLKEGLFQKSHKILSRIIFFVTILLLQYCAPQSQYGKLRNGDLLFVTAKETGLSGAINNVTQKQKEASFDHIGIVEIANNHWYVLHAAPKGGSQKQELKSFLTDQSDDGQKVMIYRLKPEYQKSIPAALKKAESMLGKPYNFNYILDESSYYCSDYIERSFREDHIFKLEPMTFIDPKTGKTNEFWTEFYKKKNLKVPQGELGCNPNGLAASDKLDKIGEL
ncbi:Permuted papain-like amidase enzyme, YaeF/YiiX, C92 family [Chryseobacterium oranimense]|uniref:Permuted papain-like amidase enzyme, YaeF/YiiX, C92 family n=1 Tax=Chryseobacterium oranimense TaxID=421058 RepID=A0A1M5V9Y7_9FLAO|nr:YiiX/YebB-like N1pC/P60 family cysteine hydrolase [Chryseobacterium oranimense]SHH72082.1 Permuted papain-like amidase enzyme, YaeF/YiiX, C92 family [Chryseobacterium oranimense]